MNPHTGQDCRQIRNALNFDQPAGMPHVECRTTTTDDGIRQKFTRDTCGTVGNHQTDALCQTAATLFATLRKDTPQ